MEDAASMKWLKEWHDSLRPAPKSPAPQMPVAPIRPTKFAFHGDSRIDNYHWLANSISTDPAVMQYIDAENAYASQILGDTLDMQADFAKLHALRLDQKAQKSPLHRSSKYVYFMEQRQNANYSTVVRKPAPLDDAAPAAENLESFEELETVMDFQRESQGYPYFNVMDIEISPDDHLLIYSLDTTGNEVGRLFVYNMTSKTHYLKAPIENVCGNVVSGNQLWYTKQKEHQRCNRLYRHELGTDPASDSLAFAVATPESTIQLARGASYLFILAVTPDISEWYVVDQANLDSGVVRLLPGEPDVFYSMGVRTTQSIMAPKHYITLETRQGCTEVAIRRFQKDPKWRVLSEPHYLRTGDCLSDAYLDMTANERNETVLVVHGTSAKLPAYKIEYNLKTKETNSTNTIILSDYNPLNYTTERIAALSWDGQRIPVSLLYKTGVLKDGTAPLLLRVYGSYGIVSRTKFSRHNIDLADQGFVVAQAHVRGGGALGSQWHRSGRRTSKMNTIKDTISVIDHLVAKNYTSHRRTALMGRSAGALSVAAIANLAPAKIKAVVADVPFLDCLTKLLNSSQPGVVENQEEFGDPRANKTVYDYIQSYSPYDNIKRESDFPHILVTTHLDDSRIPFWEPAKYVAKLREYKVNDNMVLLRVKPGGHVELSGMQADAARGETTAFLFKALDVEYDPTKAHKLLTKSVEDTMFTSTI